MTDLKKIIEQLDANAPKIKNIDWSIMERILNEGDFTKCKDTLAAMNLFYELLWVHVIFPIEDDLHLFQRENGRLIIEADTNHRKAKKLQGENGTLRERLQEAGLEEVEGH